MAENLNPIATGLEIGEGEAQVFDTSGLMDAAIKRKENLKKKAIEAKKEKEEKLLDSFVDIDTSGVWSRDLNMYNEMWGEYKDFVKINYNKLQDPSNNIDVYHEKRKLEQKLKQFVKSSGESRKIDAEIQKNMMTNEDLEDYEGAYATWQNTAGDFTNAYSLISKRPEELTKVLDKTMVKAVSSYDKNSVYEKDGVKYLRKGVSTEKFDELHASYYDNDEGIQRSADRAWKSAGGTESGYPDAKSYFIAEAAKRRPVEQTSRTEKVGGGKLSWNIGSGNQHSFGETMFTSDYINRDETPDPKDASKITAVGDRRINLSLDRKNLPYQEINLQRADGSKGRNIKVAIQSIVEVGGQGSGKYNLIVRKPKVKDENKKIIEGYDNELAQLDIYLQPYSSKYIKERAKNENKDKSEVIQDIKDEKAAIQAKKNELLQTTEKDYETESYPLTETTNIGVLEKALGVDNLFETLPKLLTKVDAGESNKPPAY